MLFHRIKIRHARHLILASIVELWGPDIEEGGSIKNYLTSQITMLMCVYECNNDNNQTVNETQKRVRQDAPRNQSLRNVAVI